MNIERNFMINGQSSPVFFHLKCVVSECTVLTHPPL